MRRQLQVKRAVNPPAIQIMLNTARDFVDNPRSIFTVDPAVFDTFAFLALEFNCWQAHSASLRITVAVHFIHDVQNLFLSIINQPM
jgi:hypothetical protein